LDLLKQHQFSALAAVCIALLAFIAGSSLNKLSLDGRADTVATGPGSIAGSQQALRENGGGRPRLIVILLVESWPRATEIMSGTRNHNTERAMFFAFKATTPEEEASVTAIAEVWQGHDVSGLAETWPPSLVLLVDLRGRGPVD
jgi:hypothetical protein